MFIVKVDLWTTDHEDYYDFEYSGIEYATREEAEIELAEVENKTKDDEMVRGVYIVEV